MLRLCLAILLFLLSFLVLFKAPTNLLWRAAVAVTEFPYIFLIVTLVLAVSTFWADKYRLGTFVICGLSFILFVLPIIKTYKRGSTLQAELMCAFPTQPAKSLLESPYGFWRMFGGIGIDDVDFKILEYKTLADKKLSLDFYPAISSVKSAPCII
ncbi:MAG: hypothetical protein M3R27_10440, partial [Bacteroidota bacterium]|nr:hypothetical protein [Bacteroidota bacterium]